jgi:hypothetical protein
LHYRDALQVNRIIAQFKQLRKTRLVQSLATSLFVIHWKIGLAQSTAAGIVLLFMSDPPVVSAENPGEGRKTLAKV